MVPPVRSAPRSPGPDAAAGSSRPSSRAAPRRSWSIAGIAVLTLVPVVWAGGSERAATSVAASGEADSAAEGAGRVQAPAPSAEPASRRDAFASIEGLALRLPSPQTLLVAFHEASRPDALELAPMGRMQDNANTTKFRPGADVAGPDYVVMSSRGRPHPATSAVDLLLHDGDPVRSPVDGTVTEVRPYHLYGRHPDVRIEIAPATRPDLRVVLIHVTEVEVAVGERVGAGTALAGGANRFPFSSHVDRYLEPARWPHVHLEVKRAEGG